MENRFVDFRFLFNPRVRVMYRLPIWVSPYYSKLKLIKKSIYRYALLHT